MSMRSFGYITYVWKGEFSTPPSNPNNNWVYRNTIEKKVYLYSNNAWQFLIEDGINGADGTDGRSPEFRIDNNIIQWRLTGIPEDTWKDLLDISGLSGSGSTAYYPFDISGYSVLELFSIEKSSLTNIEGELNIGTLIFANSGGCAVVVDSQGTEFQCKKVLNIAIGGGTGAVNSVNGELPDTQGNVEVEAANIPSSLGTVQSDIDNLKNDLTELTETSDDHFNNTDIHTSLLEKQNTADAIQNTVNNLTSEIARAQLAESGLEQNKQDNLSTEQQEVINADPFNASQYLTANESYEHFNNTDIHTTLLEKQSTAEAIQTANEAIQATTDNLTNEISRAQLAESELQQNKQNALSPEQQSVIDADPFDSSQYLTANETEEAVQTATEQAESNLAIENTRAIEKETELDELIKGSNAVAFTYDPVTHILTITRTDNTNLQLSLPVASETEDGLLPKEAFTTIQTLVRDIEALTNSALIPIGTIQVNSETFESMTEQEREAQVTTDTGVSSFNTNDAVKDLNNVTWLYTSAGWIRWGESLNVATATNTSLGLVKGVSVGNGRIFIEADGTMTLIGWDALAQHIADTVKHVTSEERSVWNAKQASLPQTSTAGQVLKSTATTGGVQWGTLGKNDVGLGNVDNTADANKVVAKSGQLTTERNIALTGDASGNANFSGASNVSIATTLAAVTRSNTVSAASPGVAGNFTVIDSVTTDTKGRITAVNTKTVTLPSGSLLTFARVAL